MEKENTLVFLFNTSKSYIFLIHKKIYISHENNSIVLISNKKEMSLTKQFPSTKENIYYLLHSHYFLHMHISFLFELEGRMTDRPRWGGGCRKTFSYFKMSLIYPIQLRPLTEKFFIPYLEIKQKIIIESSLWFGLSVTYIYEIKLIFFRIG